MYIVTSVRPFNTEELNLRRAALRDAIICMGWIKFLSIFCYVALCMFISAYSEGTCSTFLIGLILIIIPIQAISAIFLFLGAVDVKPKALHVAIWLSLLASALNTVLGVVGAIYFIRTGFNFSHFLIAAYFAFLSLSFCSVLCHDIIIIMAFIKLVQSPPDLPPDPASV